MAMSAERRAALAGKVRDMLEAEGLGDVEAASVLLDAGAPSVAALSQTPRALEWKLAHAVEFLLACGRQSFTAKPRVEPEVAEALRR